MEQLNFDNLKYIAGGDEEDSPIPSMSTDGNGSGGGFGGSHGGGSGNYMDMAGLNSSRAFSQIDNGNYSYNPPAPSYTPSVMESIMVGVQTVSANCIRGALDAFPASKAASVVSPSTNFNARMVAGIGCAAGVGGG
ncbi:hypothetical protein [Rugamonas sp. DEMB1]|uniref:hypothetical protein n=1 Tax=Rugamonas sp. DEMB1 TaxID=3039386 RepID=UPI00244CED79|nr:hypothetical protein [Rugamonas sp. DEMB1]WGG53201.1 hypothetical protein QC826_14470 [Rugamonas sp. DEMB1]